MEEEGGKYRKKTEMMEEKRHNKSKRKKEKSVTKIRRVRMGQTLPTFTRNVQSQVTESGATQFMSLQLLM
jgi:hypothetical protein